MSQEREKSLAIIGGSLAMLSKDPASQIKTATRINAEIYKSFEIERFLNELNEKLLGGKGEVRPLSHYSTIYPDVGETQDHKSSRFKRMFSTRYRVSGVNSGSELYVEKEEGVEKLKEGKYFRGLGIRIYQTIDVQNKELAIFVLGKLYFKCQRSSFGDFDVSPAFLSMMSQGRFLKFSFDSVPPGEILARTLFENAAEILKGLGAHNFIPSVDYEPDEI